MRIVIDGHELPVKNLDTARIRDVAELQQQTGWKLSQVRQEIADSDAISAGVLIFLSMRHAGLPTTWDEVQDRTLEEVRIIQDPGDIAREQPEAEASDPLPASGDSSQDAGAQAEEWPPPGD
jgi:hypothetical protein